MSRTVRVDLEERGYEIHIGSDLPLATVLAGEAGLRVLLVSDSNVDALCGGRCEERLRALGMDVRRAVVPAGEASKSMASVATLYAKAAEARLDRTSVIAALGGGMVGDLAGFVAATYLRGIRYIQIPTSLLAMVDSSVGGKTGINLQAGKNLVGAFHQPIEVDADLAALRTLPEREYRSGLAEMVKYGVIWDATFFQALEAGRRKLAERDAEFLEAAVARCCEIKAEVVAVDERESGVRAILNFGHTFAHALEKAAGYGTWLHGEAVAAGMVYAGAVSVGEKGFAETEAARMAALLTDLGLPAAAGGACFREEWGVLRTAMGADKKTQRGTPRFVLAERMGAVVFGCEVSEEKLEATYRSLQCRP